MFCTIRQAAAKGIAPENLIRRMVAQGECPGVYSGNRFLVNTELLIAKLNQISCSKEGENGE